MVLETAVLAEIAAAVAKAVVPQVLERLSAQAGSEHTDRVRRNADVADAIAATLRENPNLAAQALVQNGLGHLLPKG